MTNDRRSSGLGGPLEGHPLPRAPGVAEGQRLPLARTQTAHALVPRLLRQHLQNSHRDRQHLDPLSG